MLLNQKGEPLLVAGSANNDAENPAVVLKFPVGSATISMRCARPARPHSQTLTPYIMCICTCQHMLPPCMAEAHSASHQRLSPQRYKVGALELPRARAAAPKPLRPAAPAGT